VSSFIRAIVMAGLVPAIYVLDAGKEDVDAGDTSGHDG
jgi:hypothetical protein